MRKWLKGFNDYTDISTMIFDKNDDCNTQVVLILFARTTFIVGCINLSMCVCMRIRTHSTQAMTNVNLTVGLSGVWELPILIRHYLYASFHLSNPPTIIYLRWCWQPQDFSTMSQSYERTFTWARECLRV